MSDFNPIENVFLVSGNPHILLAPDKNNSWTSLHNKYADIKRQVEQSNADVILYVSTSWISVLGYMFQADPNPKWKHVDPNWHDLGTMHYDIQVDTSFATRYESLVRPYGFTTKLINYEGFPIDTGTIVASQLTNPENKKKSAMVSVNLYSDRNECNLVGLKALEALKYQKKKAIIVLVSNLSNRFFSEDIKPSEDRISSDNDDKWNKKLLEQLSSGSMKEVFSHCSEFCKNANGDLIDRALWWLEGLLNNNYDIQTDIIDYQAVWGTGAALINLKPISKCDRKVKRNNDD